MAKWQKRRTNRSREKDGADLAANFAQMNISGTNQQESSSGIASSFCILAQT